MPGDSGVTVVTNARVTYTPRAAAGASGARHSLRPLMAKGGIFPAKLARRRGEIAKLCPRSCLKLEAGLASPQTGARQSPFVDALPRNATGKIHKPTLRKNFASPDAVDLARSVAS